MLHLILQQKVLQGHCHSHFAAETKALARICPQECLMKPVCFCPTEGSKWSFLMSFHEIVLFSQLS